MKKKIIALLLTVCMVSAFATGCGDGNKETGSGSQENGQGDSKDQDNSGAQENNEEQESGDSGSGDEVTISFGVFETDNITAEVWQNMIDAFEADNPGIKVEKVLATGDDRGTFWKTMLNSGSLPDIVIEAEQLVSMEGVFAEVPSEIQSLFEDSLLSQNNGKVVMIPGFKQLKMQCYYNKAVFEELNLSEPKTWEEFLNICQTIKDAGKIPLMCGGTGDIWATGEPFWTAEGDPALLGAYPDFNQQLKEGTNTWNNETTIQVLSAWQDMINKGYYYEGAMSLSYSQAAEEFKKETAVMLVDGSWMAAGLDSEGNEDFGVFVLPTINGDKIAAATTSYWGVSESSKNKEAAFQFVKYVFDENQEVYKTYLMSDGLYSTTKKAVTYEQGPLTTKLVENISDWDSALEIIKLPGEFAVPNGMQAYMDKSFQNIFNGADVESEVASWDAEYQRLLDAQ